MKKQQLIPPKNYKMIDDVDNVEMCLCINTKWRIIKERYRQLEPENKNLHQRLANLTLRDDGITDLKGTN